MNDEAETKERKHQRRTCVMECALKVCSLQEGLAVTGRRNSCRFMQSRPRHLHRTESPNRIKRGHRSSEYHTLSLADGIFLQNRVQASERGSFVGERGVE